MKSYHEEKGPEWFYDKLVFNAFHFNEPMARGSLTKGTSN